VTEVAAKKEEDGTRTTMRRKSDRSVEDGGKKTSGGKPRGHNWGIRGEAATKKRGVQCGHNTSPGVLEAGHKVDKGEETGSEKKLVGAPPKADRTE